MIHADVAVIGCGAVGASCAFQLSQRGLQVVVLERAEAPAMGSSGRSAAGVRVQFTHPSNVLMSKHSLEVFRTFQDVYGEDIGYRPLGYLLLVPEAEWAAHLEAVAMQQRLGVPVETLAPDDIETLVPLSIEGLAGASWGPADGVVDPHWLTHAWVRMARRNGARFEYEQPVRSIKRRSTTWQLDTAAFRIEAPVVVNATGAWSQGTAELAGLDLAIEPLRTMIFLSDSRAEGSRYPMTIDIGSGFYLRSEGDKLLFGRTNRNQAAGFASGMDWPWLESVLESAVERFPWFTDVGVDHRGSWWGYYEMTPDHNPIIGVHPATEGSGPRWIDAAGFSGHGIMHTPATGTLVAELATTGSASTLDISAFAHQRFSRVEDSGEVNAY